MKVVKGSLIVSLVAAALVAVQPGSASAAPPSQWQALTGPAGSGLKACVAQAQAQRPQAWTCMGGDLTVTGVGGKPVTTVVAVDFKETPAVSDMAGLAADDYDSWCETGTVCGRKVNNSEYIAEVKGNGAYGNSQGVIGALDFIIRQSFEGQRPRWRNTLIWDYGPQIEPQEFTNNCRINQTGPDGYCGQNPFYFGNINVGTQRTDRPSTAGSYYYNSQVTAGSGQYHDDHYGSFYAYGQSPLFYVSTIHTGRWNRCNASPYCRYYQVPWS